MDLTFKSNRMCSFDYRLRLKKINKLVFHLIVHKGGRFFFSESGFPICLKEKKNYAPYEPRVIKVSIFSVNLRHIYFLTTIYKFNKYRKCHFLSVIIFRNQSFHRCYHGASRCFVRAAEENHLCRWSSPLKEIAKKTIL